MQSTNNIVLVRPSHFTFNTQTAGSNAFQNEVTSLSTEVINKTVHQEFNNFVEALVSNEINAIIFDDTDHPVKPDAIFPNNWVSFHKNGTVVIYPMFAENRRLEKRRDIVDDLSKQFQVSSILDYSDHEKENRFLEGTGSIVFDHINKIAYACLSPRTEENIFREVCNMLKYKPICFTANDHNMKKIYHTNVMMSIGEKFAVVCLDSITYSQEKPMVAKELKSSGLDLIEISFEQMKCFAGNLLVVHNSKKESIIILSQTAFDCLSKEQLNQLSQYGKLLPISIPTIETIGGGSVRCMMAEVFLEKRKI